MTDSKKLIHEKTIAVEWGDMDALGHVNNVRYFEYFQQARVDWLATLNMDLSQTSGPVLIQTGCVYLKPVVYPATLVLRSYLHSLGRTSFVIDYDVLQNDELMAQGTSKIVWIDYLKTQSVPIPDQIRACF